MLRIAISDVNASLLPPGISCSESIIGDLSGLMLKAGGVLPDESNSMKTALIVLLSIALLAAAFATRPGQREFALYLLDGQRSADGSLKAGEVDQADHVIKSVTIKDRILWTDIERDGKVIYSGAFAHFFPRGQAGQKTAPNTAELVKLLNR